MPLADRLRAVQALVPQRRAWVWLLAASSSLLLIFSLLATVLAKAVHVPRIGGIAAPRLVLGWAIMLDIAVYFGLAAAFAVLEHRFARARFLTIPIAALLCIFAIGNAVYLTVAGDQASRGAVEALFARFGDVVAIFRHADPQTFGTLLAVGLFVAVAIHLLARRVAGRHARSSVGRAKAAVWVAAVAGVLVVALPRPRGADARRLGRNVLVTVARAFIAGPTEGTFSGYESGKAESVPAIPPKKLPHIILLILESTRYDHTTLSGSDAQASTPNLAALAKDAFQVPVMRATVPHTTKALFTLLCGQLPLLQRELWELSDDIRPECLPAALLRLGYHTAFFQSAQGLFEQRARLVDKLGYEHFQPWEDIRGQRLGYIGSDDASMLRPLRQWLDERDASGNPFFITILTSSPHHPYKLPSRVERELEDSGLPHEEAADKYARLIETEDDLLGRLLDVLEFRSLRQDTVVIVLGDHGEGFGDHGVKQHDQNIYEEALRVPFVIAGPGVPNRMAKGNGAALDFLPTLLSILDLEGLPDPKTLPGVDLVHDDVPPDRPRWLSCWFANRCRGFILDNFKVIEEPDTKEVFYFDLSADPTETNPLPLTKELEVRLEEMKEVFAQQTITDRDIIHPELRKYGLWWCPKDDDKCKHPGARHPDFRWQPDGEPAADGKVVTLPERPLKADDKPEKPEKPGRLPTKRGPGKREP